jgi:ankyrin repeat protein
LPNLEINSIAQSGNSLPHLCVTLQRVDLLELLLKFYPNLNLNQRNQQDATPLHLSIIFDDLPMARFLLQAGGDGTLTMKNKSCVQIAEEFQLKEFIDLFSKRD